MQSEYLDKKIKDAAESPVFSYDEKSWDNMETLLDKHLPLKKRRRGLFLILLVVGLGLSASIFMFTNSWNERSATKAETKSNITEQVEQKNEVNTELKTDNKAIESPSDVARVKDDSRKNISTELIANDTKTIRERSDEQKNLSDEKFANDRKSTMESPAKKIQQGNKKIKANQIVSNDFLIKKQDPTSNNDNDRAKINKAVAQQQPISSTHNQITAKSSVKNQVVADSTSKADFAGKKSTETDSTKINEAVPSKKMAASKKKGRFTISPGIGPDLSGVSNNPIGTVKARYGLGFAYNISGNLGIRTGFYITRKVYGSDSSGYHPPASFWMYYPNLQKVDANCLVYEIPLSLTYTLYRRQKNSIFISPGISSYIMKKEKYVNTYKNSWGNLQTHDLNFENENKHWFSVATLSAGFTHEVNKKISFTAEPYMQIPLAGVGFGKVKLKSAGVLFSVGIRPFTGKR